MGQAMWCIPRNMQTVLDCRAYVNELMQERRNSLAKAQELRLSCTNPSMCYVQLDAVFRNWSVLPISFTITSLALRGYNDYSSAKTPAAGKMVT